MGGISAHLGMIHLRGKLNDEFKIVGLAGLIPPFHMANLTMMQYAICILALFYGHGLHRAMAGFEAIAGIDIYVATP
jgi:hypothetical protein